MSESANHQSEFHTAKSTQISTSIQIFIPKSQFHTSVIFFLNQGVLFQTPSLRKIKFQINRTNKELFLISYIINLVPKLVVFVFKILIYNL